MKLVLTMAVRSLLRHRWRTGLAAGGIAVAAVMLIWNLAFIDGFYEAMIRSTTDVEIGHVQVQHRDYVDRPSTLDYFEWDEELDREVSQVAGVQGLTPRVRLFGIIGHEDRSYISRIMGVDAQRERSVSLLAESVSQGRWLSDEARDELPAEAVIGVGLSRALDVGLGDELVVIAEGADGSMGDSLLEVVGILESGNSAVDRQAALIHFEEAQYVAAVEGAAHELIITTADPTLAPEIASRVQATLNGMERDELQARPWQEVTPGLYEMLALGEQSNFIIFLVIAFIVALGVLNVLRMSARERYREFGVMLSVGLSRSRLFAMILVESLALGIIGAAVGAAAGGALSHYHATEGLDLGAFMEGDATYMGISMSDRLYFVVSPETILFPAIGLVVVTVLCALWPAIAAIGLEPRDAITGRQ